MVLCIIALPIFVVLGIFSATYRRLAKEAFICVFKKVTFSPCDTGLDTRIKTSVVGPIFRINERAGKFVYRYFTALSWFFVILSIATLAGVAYGGYNYYLYGNCNGPESTGFCIFDPTGANGQFTTSGLGTCSTGAPTPEHLQFSAFNVSLFETLSGSATLKNGAPKELYMVGCYNCKYTREAWPVIRNLQRKYNFTLVFAHLPLVEDDKFASRAGICVSQQNPAMFWSFADAMFASPINESRNETFVLNTVTNMGVNMSALDACINSTTTNDSQFYQMQSIEAVGVYGTPTIYDPSQNLSLVGPKPARVYERLVN